MSIIGEPFAPYVDAQIKVRQELMGETSNRSPEMLAWANAKTAWVKLASGVSLSGSFAEERLKAIGLDSKKYLGEKLAKEYILFGGTSKLIDNINRVGDNFGEYSLSQRSTFEEVYDPTDTDFGLVPMPGVESVSVQDKNRGSIKEATIEIIANSRKQLEILDILYLRLGYTVLLEWGNSHYIDNNKEYKEMGSTITEISDSFFSKTTPNYREVYRKIEGLRGRYSGNYDGFVAKVVNFNWTFQPDGTYKITLKLISLGDVVESFKINYPPKIIGKDEPKSKNPIEKLLNDYIISYSKNQGDPITSTIKLQGGSIMGGKIGRFLGGGEIKFNGFKESKTASNPQKLQELKQNLLSFYPQLSKIVDESPNNIKYYKEIVNIGLLFTTPLTSTETRSDIKKDTSSDLQKLFDSEYIGLGVIGGAWDSYTFEMEVDDITITLPKGNNDVFHINGVMEEGGEIYVENSANYYIKFSSLTSFINSEILPIINKDIGNKLLSVEISDSNIKYMPNQISFDPRVCIVSTELSYDDNTKSQIFPELENYVRIDRNTKEPYGYIPNLYLNFSTILDSLNSNQDERGDVSLLKFLDSLCEKINKALGGVNNLQTHVDENNVVVIIDSSIPSPNINTPQTKFQIFGYKDDQSTFVRNVDLKTEISPNFASMVTIGSTASGYSKGMESTAFSKWNRGIVDRFKQEITQPPNTTITGSINEAEVNYKKYLNQGEGENILQFLGYSKIEGSSPNKQVFIDNEQIEQNLSIATEFFKYLRAKTYEKDPENYASTSNGFIPFNLQLTMDGLSGMKIWNKVEVDTRFLPYNYPESLKFVIKRVSHKISNGDWETSIDTTVMPGSYSPNP
jgi:hypothetical protein